MVGSNVLADILPSQIDRLWMIIGAWFGAAYSYCFSSFNPLIYPLLVFLIADFLSGTVAALITGEWKSSKNFIGVVKKSLMLFVVILAQAADIAFSVTFGNVPIIQNIVICMFIAGEFGSVIENIDRAGLGDIIPSGVRGIVNFLQEWAEKKSAEKGLNIKKGDSE